MVNITISLCDNNNNQKTEAFDGDMKALNDRLWDIAIDKNIMDAYINVIRGEGWNTQIRVKSNYEYDWDNDNILFMEILEEVL